MELLWTFFVDPGSVPVFFLAQEPLLSASLDVQEKFLWFCHSFFGHACRLSFPTFPDLLHGGEIVLRRHCSRPCGIQGTMDNHVVTLSKVVVLVAVDFDPYRGHQHIHRRTLLTLSRAR